ncbi:MAG: AAA family ATPase [Planctomycetota bacterium]|jgi:cell division protease FtsH
MSKKPLLFKSICDHFDSDPAQLPVLAQNYPSYERANLHLAIQEVAKMCDDPPELRGIVLPDQYQVVSLSKLSRPASAKQYDEGPIEYFDVSIPNQKRISCVKQGLYLFRIQNRPFALLVTEQEYGRNAGLISEIMAFTLEEAESLSHRLTRLVHHGKAFRGQVLSVERNCYGSVDIKFHRLPDVDREKVILPAEVLDRIERQTIGFSANANRLAAAGRHLKRGILLHGPPGTGKTFTAMYLASRMPDRTVFLITGGGMNSIETACNMARVLVPATIILEDVDLIGTQRDRQMVDANALLFELLNQMDGLADDSDILFVLTTNRPDVLEPALAARPGRIDQAIAVPPPDENCRRRLFDLYSQGLTLKTKRRDEIIKKIDGVSAAFIRELLRKAAVFAAMDSQEDLIIRDKHLDEALDELLVTGGTLTQSLLGARISGDS